MTRVLVVDDESQNRYLLEVLLGGDGYEVSSASNGREALAAARRRTPDLVISDILMPDMDGFLLCRAMKADATLRSVPFVFYTATYTEAEDERVAIEAGGISFSGSRPSRTSCWPRSAGCSRRGSPRTTPA